jgi:hypothetical protein
MTDDPFYARGYRPPARQPRPSELLWTVRTHDGIRMCEFLFNGAGVGWEARVFEIWRGGVSVLLVKISVQRLKDRGPQLILCNTNHLT